MIFALNYPAAKQWMNVVEALPPQKCVAVKTAATLPVVGLLWWWYTSVFAKEKQDYNATNAYFGCIPLLGYVFLRNVTPTLRSHYAHSLHELGKVTLETYLLQHHLWLSSNAKTLLRLIPQEDWRACNMLVTTALYFVCSRELYRLTMSLRGMMLPDRSGKECIRNLAGLFAVMGGSWVVGAAVRSAAGGSKGAAAPMVTFFSLLGGGGLCCYLIRYTSYKSSHSESDDEVGAASEPLLQDKPSSSSPADNDKEGAGVVSFPSTAGHASFIAGGIKGQTFKTACFATSCLVAVLYLVMGVYFGERPSDPTEVSSPAAVAAKPMVPRQPGEMAQPLLGLGILFISLVMLGSMDSYFGIPMLALKIFGGDEAEARVTYEGAYSRLLSHLGFGETLPSTTATGVPKDAAEGENTQSAHPPNELSEN
jgi:hypothetical protein